LPELTARVVYCVGVTEQSTTRVIIQKMKFSDTNRPVGISADFVRSWRPGSQMRSNVGRRRVRGGLIKGVMRIFK